MPPKAKQQKKPTTEEILRDMLIVQLGLAGLPQDQIREIVGVDMFRVNRIVKRLRNLRRQNYGQRS